MKQRILEKFSEVQDTTAGERLLTLRQVGTVKEYIRDFVALANNAPELSEAVRELAFMVGLKPKIRAGVKMFEPRTLKKMMSLEKTVEELSTSEIKPAANISEGSPKHSKPNSEKNTCGPSIRQGPNNYKPKIPSHSTQTPTTTFQGPNNKNQAPAAHGRLKTPFQKLTPAEYAKWRSEGLCYKCDEKWTGTHVCGRKELMVLVVHENEIEREIWN